jgi:hypothetical protein
MLTASAITDVVRYQRVLDVMTKAGVPHSWLTMLGVLKRPGRSGCWSVSGYR